MFWDSKDNFVLSCIDDNNVFIRNGNWQKIEEIVIFYFKFSMSFDYSHYFISQMKSFSIIDFLGSPRVPSV